MQSKTKDITTLKTIKNYALDQGVTTSYIYKLIKELKLDAVNIDGVSFIDTTKNPSIRK
jgi:hypothetical protein